MKGLILRSTGSWYDILAEDGKTYQGRLRGKMKMAGLKVTNPIAVGDSVEMQFEEGSADWANISKILPRKNYIIRQSVHKSAHGHLIAANVDQCALFVTLTYPKTSFGFVDRFLISAEAFRIPVTLIFNKTDLLSDDQREELDEYWIKTYAPIGYPCLKVSALENIGLEELKSLFHGKKTLIAGHSGTGKSTWLNLVKPGLNLRTSAVSDFANKGVHTTTFAEMFQLEDETFIIDSPGIKELGLVDMQKEDLSHYFPEMRDLLGQCKFYNCTHLHEPGCVVRDAVESGKIAPTRYNSYLSMIENDDNRR
ncbi:MAG: ribosome small subunit-dependent GTPase A [Cytophagales bacterium]|nr:ribosome small subunit-dependent GTPase A [Cytophagales bacterium]